MRSNEQPADSLGSGCGPSCNHDLPIAARPISRRMFLRSTTAALAVTGIVPNRLFAGQSSSSAAETKVKELFDSFSADQKKSLCFPFEHELQRKVSANWAITPSKIEDLAEPQQEMIESILKGLTSEDGYEKFQVQMEKDGGGLNQYHIALFGEPGDKNFEFVMTGRHMTMRADGNSIDKVCFGGPMFYGHAAESFNEGPSHRGNVFWYQAVRANEVFAALNPDQRKIALVEKSPNEDAIDHRATGYAGLAVGQLSSDQKELVDRVMADLLSPYRKNDVDEVLDVLKANGGLDKIHLAYYQLDQDGKNGDIGKDGVWDIWRMEGPGFVWHFRGFPHVHTWVNIARV
jgi:hypothetical protein